MKGQGKGYDNQQRSTRRSFRGDSEVADWASVDAQAIANCVVFGAANGWAIRFGYTRDGGAYTLGVLGDGEPYTEYIRPTEDIHLALAAFAQYAENSGK